MSRLGARFLEKAGKQVTNGPYWRPFLGESKKRGHQWAVLAPVFRRKREKRSPMGRIGAHF
jgi:hypothetical protein